MSRSGKRDASNQLFDSSSFEAAAKVSFKINHLINNFFYFRLLNIWTVQLMRRKPWSLLKTKKRQNKWSLKKIRCKCILILCF